MVSIPNDAILQPNESINGQESGARSWSISYKGVYSTLRAAAFQFEKGDKFSADGYKGILSTWQVSRLAGEHGTLTLNLTPIGKEGEDEEVDSKLLKDVWSIHGVRNDKSILAKCGDSDSEANRARIEAWQKEPDGALAAKFQFRDSNDEIVDLNEGEKKIAEKFQKGIDSVMRFYPLITRKRIYDSEPDVVLENLSKLDTPPVPASISSTVKGPKGLKAVVQKYKWLKCQDDADENDDGTWMRVESWMGAANWDEDLYGENAWEI